MADGKGCTCAAYDESECACDADWTPQELIDARAEIARLRLTDAEREAVEATIVDLDGGANFNEQRFWPMLAKRLRERSATLRGLLERLANEVGGRLVPLLATDFAAQAPDFASQPPDIAGSVTIRQPVTLTDAEREAVDTAEASLMRESTDLNTPLPVRQRLGAAAATLRGLLERLK